MSTRVETKIVKETKGKGQISEKGQFVTEAAYSLKRHQQIHHARTFGPTDSRAEGLGGFHGLIEASDIRALIGRPLTLRLENGQHLEIIVTKELYRGLGFFRGNGGLSGP
jgi:hypothetical protein